ncbi:MAG: carbonate dehydratase, partial [Pseudomonadota bacterium]|nr:carbonate dehydratase [Pseudomonadota bacterium]
IGNRVFIGFNTVLFDCTVNERCVVRHNSVVDGCVLPAGLYVPSTTHVNRTTDLSSFSMASNAASEFSESVAETNIELVKGYKHIQNEF